MNFRNKAKNTVVPFYDIRGTGPQAAPAARAVWTCCSLLGLALLMQTACNERPQSDDVGNPLAGTATADAPRSPSTPLRPNSKGTPGTSGKTADSAESEQTASEDSSANGRGKNLVNGTKTPGVEVGYDSRPASIQIQRKELHVDPSEDGWETEVLHDAISQQLKKLALLLSQPSQLDATNLTRFVESDDQSVYFTPIQLETVFEDESIRVRRAASSTGEGRSIEGAADFESAVKQLVEPFLAAKGNRAKFKVFRISSEQSFIESDAYYEMSGHTAEGIFQQRGIWKCRWRMRDGTAPLLTSVSVANYEDALGKSPGMALFQDCTESVLGSSDSFAQQFLYSTDYWLQRIEFRYGIDPSAWQGLAVADVNGDGLDDVYICQPGGLPNRLYVRNEDGTATDFSKTAGVDWLDHTQSALFVDLDNDSDQDLVLATKLGLIYCKNGGQGRFEPATVKLIPAGTPYSLSAVDFDNDRDLDVYACCYSARNLKARRRFIQRPIPYHDAKNGGRNVLFRNDGRWRFRDVTQLVGLDENNDRFSFAASWDDFDNDGDLDLYVANDYGRNNLYENDGKRFRDVAADAGVEDISAGMSVSWGDYDNDGWMDIYVSNMFSSAGNRIAYQRRFQSDSDQTTRGAFQRHARGNSLFRNLGNGTFADESVAANVTMGRWAWSSNFVDINNDGLEDIIVANGFITQEDSRDL